MNERAITEAIVNLWPERAAALKELMTLRIDHLQRTIDERQVAIGKALELQAKENERRLEILNGEAGRLRDMQSTYLPREVYDANHRQILKDLAELKEFSARQQGRSQIISVVTSFVISLVIGMGTVIGTRLVR